jgi:TetR/AcrR family transcriptional regulator
MARTGEESEKTARVRGAILDATEQIMRKHGYAAVTSRLVAKQAGLKSHLLHYYYRTMDQLFVAVWERYDDRFLERQAGVLDSSRPLKTLWQMSTDTADATLRQEFIALANRRKPIRALIARSARRNRKIQATAITRYFKHHGVSSGDLPPMTLVLLFAFVSRAMITEQNLGISDNHQAIINFIKRKIKLIEAESSEGKARNTALGKA